jgi:hypothetical protein
MAVSEKLNKHSRIIDTLLLSKVKAFLENLNLAIAYKG